MKELESRGYTYISGEVNNVRDYIKIKHNECGNEYEVRIGKFLEGNSCPKCSIRERSEIMKGKYLKDDETFKKEVFRLVGDEYTFLEEYIGGKDKILCRHNICKNTWRVRPNDFLSNNVRCPKCKYEEGRSRLEKELTDFIRSIYNGKIEFSNREILKGKELDIYLPDLKIAIEFNGLYWHSEEGSRGRCHKNYHVEKLEECLKLGIRLINISEDEWNFKKDIVKSKIKHILGLNNNPKIYARDCYVEEISSKHKSEFLNNNHIQGNDKSILNLGLWYPYVDDEGNEIHELVAVMTFCELRKSMGRNKKEGHYELSRFASTIHYRVIGAFGKLWNYFINNYQFKKIITYADRRWSVGNMYEKCRFKLDHISKPNYWYTDGRIREYRYKYRKQKLKVMFPDLYDENKTEKEIMSEAGYYKIWDCGNLVYEYNNPNT